MDWKPDNYTLAFLIKGWTPIESIKFSKTHDIIHNNLIATGSLITYILPKLKDRKWFFVCDTDKDSPDDIIEQGSGVNSRILEHQNDYTIQPGP